MRYVFASDKLSSGRPNDYTAGLAATRRSVCIHQMNHVNSRNGLAMIDSIINTVIGITIIIIT